MHALVLVVVHSQSYIVHLLKILTNRLVSSYSRKVKIRIISRDVRRNGILQKQLMYILYIYNIRTVNGDVRGYFIRKTIKARLRIVYYYILFYRKQAALYCV